MVSAAANQPLRAASLMLASTVSFGLMVISIRFGSQALHTFEIAFFRNVFGLLAVLPLMIGIDRAALRTRQLPRYFLRSALGIASMFASFWAIAHLPLAQAISLTYSTPIFVTIAATLFLGEHVRARRWLAVAAGFIGVLVIVRPGSTEFSSASLIALMAAVLGGIISIQMKQLSHVDSANTIVLYTYLFWVPLSLPAALMVWQWPHGTVWIWVICAGIFGTAGQVLWTHALKLGEVSALTPISFMQLPIVAMVGWLYFDETIDRWTLLGAAIILGANAYIAHREAVLARRTASAAATSAVTPGE